MRRRTLQQTLVLLLLATTRGNAQAQVGEIRVGEASTAYHPSVLLDSGARIALHDTRFRLTLPKELASGRTYLLPGASYQLMRILPSSAETPSPDSLHLLSLEALIMHRISERWAGAFGTSYGVASDLGGPLNAADAFMAARGILLYELHPELRLGVGVAYDSRTGQIRTLPLAAVFWQPMADFAFRGVIPGNANLQLRVAQPVTLEINARLDGQRYRVNDETDRHVELAYSVIKVGAGARFHLNEHLHCEALGGVLMRRRLEVFVDDRTRGDGFLPPGPFIGVSAWIGDSGWEVR